MSRYVKCDNCGTLQVDPFRLEGDAREEAWAARANQVNISVEHNDDSECFDACSWACVAEMAFKRIAITATPEDAF